MISNSRDKDFASKQENGLDTGQNNKRLCTSKAWSLLKDPRIVRVSRSFGKKDRHSKVSTIRGLRDRRVRLSVPTAIQLYDLQERLGLNQPSKVVDWLLNAAQHEINVLPPLQMLQENPIQYPQLIPTSHASQHQDPSVSLLDTNLDCFKDRGSHSLNLFSNEVNEKSKNVVIEEEQSILPKPTYWNSDGNLRAKSKDDSTEMGFDKSNWNKRFGQENQDANHVHSSQTLSHNPFSLLNHSSHLSLVNTAIPHNPFYDREPPNVAMSQSGANEYSSQIEELHKFNMIPIPSSLSLSSGSQLLLYQSITTPSTLLPYISNPLECDSKQVSYSQVLSLNSQNAMPPSLVTSLYSISPTMRQFQVNMNHNNQHHQNNQAITWHKGSSGTIDAFGSNDSKLVLGSNASSTHVWICRSNEEHLD